MSSEQARRSPDSPRSLWDGYVGQWDGSGFDSSAVRWPGDEWGTPELWEIRYRQLFEPAGLAEWSRAVEIGPGSGKYTSVVLERSQASVRAYDVSPRFLEVCEKRCADAIAAERLSLHLLDGTSPHELVQDLDACGWRRTIDALYSIDAMVHVSLQYMIAYIITAGLVLRPGGKLVLTVANTIGDFAFQKLLDDIALYFPLQGQASSKFAWLSPDIVQELLPRAGFELERLISARTEVLVVASLNEPARADALEKYLHSTADEVAK